MKVMFLTSLRIIACYHVYVTASPISTATSDQSSKSDNDALKPITIEVAPNGIVAPGHADRKSTTRGLPNNHYTDDLEDSPIILTEEEDSPIAVRYFDVSGIDRLASTGPLSKRHHHHHHDHHHYDNHNLFQAGGLRLGHGPVVQSPRPIVASGTPSSTPSIADPQPIFNETEPRYLVIPLSQNDRILSSADLFSSDAATSSKVLPSTYQNDKPSTEKSSIGKSSMDKSPVDKPPVDKSAMDKFFMGKSPVDTSPADKSSMAKSPIDISPANKYPGDKSLIDTSPANISPMNKSPADKFADNKTPYGDSFPKGILPTIPRCLDILRPLRDLAERLVYIKEAPHHTLMSACQFQALNRTQYDGRHVERMRELCWDLFETIQQEGRRRWERCISKAEDKVHYNSGDWAEGDPIYEMESGVDKFSFRAYQLTPGVVKEFIAEHPDLSPDDIEWLMHDTNSTDATSPPPNKRSISKRSWLADVFKSIFAAEINTTINQVGNGVESLVSDGIHDYQKTHAQNKTSNSHPKHSSHKNTTSAPHTKRNPQSNRVYVHGKWFPIAPINKYVNHPRATPKLPFGQEDVNSYLEFVRETRHLSRRQYKRLKAAVERELKLSLQFERPAESTAEAEDPHGMQTHDAGHSDIHKRSGQPPRLEPGFKYPYQWDFPSDLITNPAYINLTLAWNNIVSLEQKAWIGLQLRNVWALRAGDLCNISHSWTKDLSEESQEIELKFKGLSLQRCKEIGKGAKENLRIGDYWQMLAKGSSTPKKPSTRDPTLDDISVY